MSKNNRVQKILPTAHGVQAIDLRITRPKTQLFDCVLVCCVARATVAVSVVSCDDSGGGGGGIIGGIHFARYRWLIRIMEISW